MRANDETDYEAFVVFEDETYHYGFDADTFPLYDAQTPEEVAEALCPRDNPVEVIIVE